MGRSVFGGSQVPLVQPQQAYNMPEGGPNTFHPGKSPGYESPYGIIQNMIPPETWNKLSPEMQLAVIKLVLDPASEDAVGAAQAAYNPQYKVQDSGGAWNMPPTNPSQPSTPMPQSNPTPSPEGTPTSLIQQFLSSRR